MNKSVYVAFALILLLAGCTSPDLIATQSTTEYLQGQTTHTYTFNNTVPGPTLRARVGEEFNLQVQNTLPEPITMHWHGVRVPNEMDGVPHVTQEPIQPGETFTYTFTPQDAGVYWYHSHVEAHKQVEMGLQGALIIEDDNITIPSDTTNVLVLDDVAINPDGTYKSFELNYMHGRFGNVLLTNGQPNPTITSYGNKHRFQLVNTANARSFQLSFDNKPITIYATDIGYDQPRTTKTLTMHPGERYDVIVESNESFTIRHLSQTTTQLAHVNVQPLAYNAQNTLRLPTNELSVPEELHTQKPDMTLSLQGVRKAGHGLVWQINGTDSLTNPGTFNLPQGYTKMRLYNTQGQPHPMHLHGQQFQILSRNGQPVDDPSWKDNVMVGSQETIDLAVYAHEPGEWVLHCHILEHARAGMLATMRVEAT